jgi:tRNA-binding EMAP/Myf-like protein
MTVGKTIERTRRKHNVKKLEKSTIQNGEEKKINIILQGRRYS